MENCYSICDSLGLYVGPTGEGFALDENEGQIMDKAHIHMSNVIGFTTNGEREGAMGMHNCRIPFEVKKLQCFNSEGFCEGVFGGSDGAIEVAEIPEGGRGKSGVGVARRRVENCRIDVVERRVWVREELVRWKRQDRDVVSLEFIVSPVTARLGRPNQISHGSVEV